MESVDVAIVGGGPAGSGAAITAAEGGADTLVIEKGVPRADRHSPGADSTDAAGFIDYWVDMIQVDPEDIPDDVIIQRLEGAEFNSPSTKVTITETGQPSTYPDFGFTFHRARFDDWLREEAESAGAQYRIGKAVRDVETTLNGGHTHELVLSDGEVIEATYLILADGPQRTVTIGALDQFMPEERSVADILSSPKSNHIAYQEHRRIPDELFDPSFLKLWWGIMPGHTAYPWIFPNDNNIGRIGLTMPIGLDIDDFDKTEWDLLREDDDRIPRGNEYIRRLLEREFPSYDIDEFPLVTDRGKKKGVETYSISSTRPIESPVAAGIAVAGGAMGTTSAFHEGGDHVAVRSGKIAGELAANDRLELYNDEWKRAIGDEIRASVVMADITREFRPHDWDRAFSSLDGGMLVRAVTAAKQQKRSILKCRPYGFLLYAKYLQGLWKYRGGRFVQLTSDEYEG